MGKTITPTGRACKAQMTMKNISLSELAEKANLSRTYVSGIINGRYAGEAADTQLKKICLILGVEPPDRVASY